MAERISAGLLAYVAGDAFGLPWEGQAPHDVRMDALEALPDSEVWASGDTSDDTALTLMVAEHICRAEGLGEPLDLLRELSTRGDALRGLGPSTTRAIETFRRTGSPDRSGSDTNGAPMRAMPIGWALPPSADARRREWTTALTEMTHTGLEAVGAAWVVSACASWSIEGAPPDVLAEVASEEAKVYGRAADLERAMAAVAAGRWTPPAGGVSLAAGETVAAVLHCCLRADGELDQALRLAVSLGGDTDTVAALVGGLLGSRSTPADVRRCLTWIDKVRLPPTADVTRLGAGLAGIRLAHG